MASYEDKQSRPAIAQWRICTSCGSRMVEAVQGGEKVLVCKVCMRITTKVGMKMQIRELRSMQQNGEGDV